jgi:glycine C-acetyltransferase
MYGKAFKEWATQELTGIRDAGLYKHERIITTPQAAAIGVLGGKEVLNFCANNYLGLSSHPKVVEAAKEALDEWGYGMSSVRFICGTQKVHKDLERKIADFLGLEDCILYSSCFDANGGLFEVLLDEDCAIISDQLNHASIIDGIRLCKARRERYANADMADLKRILELEHIRTAKRRLIATDGAFSMDGNVAPLDKICDIAEKYDCMVMVDDSHCTGFMGKTGRGTHEYRGVMGRVDVITSTLGKAMGGASGGFTAGPKEVVELLRNRSRPYLFSNTLTPPIAASALVAFDLITETTELRDKLENNTRHFREKMTAAGFAIKPGDHPIVPIMLGEAKLAVDMASDMLAEGIYVIGFSYPVVPKGQARIRVQLSAAHEIAHIDRAIAAFIKVGRKHGVIS